MSVMTVETFGGTAEEIAEANTLKFVLSEREGLRALTLARPARHLQHIDLLPKNATLVGAGEINEYDEGYRADWYSKSCLDAKGYDRPDDREAARRAIVEIRDAFTAWQKRVLAPASPSTYAAIEI